MTTQQIRELIAKTREFWIEDFSFDLGWSKVWVAEFPHKDSIGKGIHVIEYSAYEQLQAKLAIATEALESWLKFEDESISKYGPYSNSPLTGLIASGKEALKQIEELNAHK